MKPVTNASHDFLFAKVHGMWANAVRGDKLQRLLRNTTVENLQRELTALGFANTRREAFHKELVEREMTVLNGIRSRLDRRTAAFYDAIMARVYYENLKTVLNYRFFPEREVDIASLLIELPWLPALPVEDLLQTQDLEDFLGRLPMAFPEDATPMAELIRELSENLDIMAAECAIDQLNYANLLNRAEATPMGIRGELGRLLRREIDIVNLCMLLRSVRTYHLPPERLSRFWVHDGDTLSADILDELAQSESHPAVIRSLPHPFQTMLEPFSTAELFLSENTLWNHLFQEAMARFRDFDRPSLSIAAYPFLLRSETLNLGRVFEGVHFGIPSRDMRDMMIGA